MKQLTLSVTNRKQTGRGPARRLRGVGTVPAVIYGKSGSRSLAVDERSFRMLMRAKGASIALVEIKDDEGKQTLSLIQDVQRHPRTDHFVHIDFKEVLANEELRAEIPVRVTGVDDCVGVKIDNGMLEVLSHKVTVRCLPKDLPEFLVVDVANLRANENVQVKDLPAVEGVTFQGDPNRVLIACALPEEETEEEKAAAAPAAGAASAAPAAGAAAPAAAAKAAPAKK